MEFRAKIKPRSTDDTAETVFPGTVAHVAGADRAVVMSPPFPAPNGFSVTAKMVSGVPFSLVWFTYRY